MSSENFVIKGFLETSFLDWTGKVASVIFLSNCNFRCPYCHNHQLVLTPHMLAGFSLDAILDRLNNFSEWIDGVVISGGEPTLFDGLPHLISSIKNAGFLVKLDTNGSNPAVLKKLLEEELLDYIAMDVKAPLDEFHYRRVTGSKVDVENIRQSVELLMSNRIEYEFRTTICSALLGPRDCEELFQQLAGAKRLILQNFRSDSTLDSRLKDVKPLSSEEMQEMQTLASNWIEECRVVC